MKARSVLSMAALTVGAALAVQPAFAAPASFSPSYCGISGTNADGLSTSDVTFNSQIASGCYGVAGGNDSASSINALAWSEASQPWTLLVKDEVGASTNMLSGIEFSLTTTAGTSGNWTLTATDTNGNDYANLPTTMDFVAVLKASDRYAAYFFDDQVVGGSNSGTWEITFLNNGNQTPALSHLTLYTRVDSGGGIPAAIPEAETYAMMLAGLGLVGLAVRRRSRSMA